MHPVPQRDASRLLVMDKKSGSLGHHGFSSLPDHLLPSDVLVINETRVIPARLAGRTANGHETEFLLVRSTPEGALAMVRGLKKLKPGEAVDFGNGLSATFAGREGEMGLFSFNLAPEALAVWLESYGHIQLPPYITRADGHADRERYQTVFAAKNGSCAAPTAGLHFTPELFRRMAEKGVEVYKICLHVGPGTFRPFTGDDISGYRPDAEYAEVPQELYEKLEEAKARGGRVIAVGTTTTRALETAALRGGGYAGYTGLFIYPGFEFKMVDAIVTNFHLPRSSLLALVCAFAGREKTLAAYAEAIRLEYRFYSYGDAMFIA